MYLSKPSRTLGEYLWHKRHKGQTPACVSDAKEHDPSCSSYPVSVRIIDWPRENRTARWKNRQPRVSPVPRAQNDLWCQRAHISPNKQTSPVSVLGCESSLVTGWQRGMRESTSAEVCRWNVRIRCCLSGFRYNEVNLRRPVTMQLATWLCFWRWSLKLGLIIGLELSMAIISGTIGLKVWQSKWPLPLVSERSAKADWVTK